MAKMAFDSGKFMDKVSALAMYDSSLLQNLYNDPMNKQKINRGAALLLKNYFNQYLDSKARQDHMSYHHVYEFDMTGNDNGRLFKAIVNNTGDGSAVITYSFTSAKNPNREGYPFPNKAEVMEAGETIIIRPKRAKYLHYELSDGRFIKSEQSIVTQPGGPRVGGNFEKTFKNFMSYQAKFVLSRSRYFERIEQTMITERRLVIPRINQGITTDAIQRGKMSAAKITNGVPATYA
jgi:hypothetical protein